MIRVTPDVANLDRPPRTLKSRSLDRNLTHLTLMVIDGPSFKRARGVDCVSVLGVDWLNVRFGSLADIEIAIRDVCFASESGHYAMRHKTTWYESRELN